MLSFLLFARYYFTQYNAAAAADFRDGVQECVAFIRQNGMQDVNVTDSVYYPQILYFAGTPPQVYLDTVEYSNYPSAFLDVTCFDIYTIGIDYDNLGGHQAYLVEKEQSQQLADCGYQIEIFGQYCVAWRP